MRAFLPIGAVSLLLGCRGQPDCVPPEFVEADTSRPGNVLVVILDDVGVEQLGRWGMATRPATTPTLDCLCDWGLSFDQGYASAVCSPTRAEIQTGRYAQRVGLGDWIHADADNPYEVPTSAASLPAIARRAGFRTGMFGKWHLAEPTHDGAHTHPNRFGYDRFAGSMSNVVTVGGAYGSWRYVVDGVASRSDVYTATATVDDALDFLAEGGDQPWLVVLSFHNAHMPLHDPPDELVADPATDVDPWQGRFLDMIQATDTELGRFLGSLSPWDHANTTIVLLGDNGSVTDRIPADIDAGHGKGSLDEAGIRVPIVVAGRGVAVRGARTDAIAHAIDLVPTVAELLGVDLPEAVDGRSWAPLFEDPSAGGHPTLANFRSHNVGGPPVELARTIRDATHKLTIDAEGVEHLQALVPGSLAEGPDLLVAPGPDELAVLDALRAQLSVVEATMPW